MMQLLLWGILLTFISCNSPFILGGIAINPENKSSWCKALKKTGMNALEVTVYGRQGVWDSDNFSYDTTDVSIIEEIRHAKKNDLKVALIVRVALDHAYTENTFLWHGMIMPKDEVTLTAWFRKYNSFVLYWAKIAEKQGVDFFAIGSELRVLSATMPVNEIPNLEAYYLDTTQQNNYLNKVKSFQSILKTNDLWVRGHGNYSGLDHYLSDKNKKQMLWAKALSYDGQKDALQKINHRRAQLLQHWQKTIHRVRKVYGGKMTYAANFDNYQNIAFWRELDFIGVNAYFKLKNTLGLPISQAQLLDTFKVSWSNIFNQLDGFRIKEKLSTHPYLFTEMGYTLKRNCSIAPWASTGFEMAVSDQNKDSVLIWSLQDTAYLERALIVKALYHTHLQYPELLKGILYWKLTTKDYHLPYEPYALLIGSDLVDPLEGELLNFLE